LCGKELEHDFVDLGTSPLYESFVPADKLDGLESYFPPRTYVCDSCFLVQLKEYVSPDDIFREYAYFSSYSTSWVEHARTYCGMIKERLALGPESLAVALASNDGYLLQHFLWASPRAGARSASSAPVREPVSKWALFHFGVVTLAPS
jgi:hypothetical protein